MAQGTAKLSSKVKCDDHLAIQALLGNTASKLRFLIWLSTLSRQHSLRSVRQQGTEESPERPLHRSRGRGQEDPVQERLVTAMPRQVDKDRLDRRVSVQERGRLYVRLDLGALLVAGSEDLYRPPSN